MKLKDIEIDFNESIKRSRYGGPLEGWAVLYGKNLIRVAKAAQRTNEICELVNMGDEPRSAIGDAQNDLTKGLEELVR